MAYLDNAKIDDIVSRVGPAALRRALNDVILDEIALAIATDAVAGGVGPFTPAVAGVIEALKFVYLDANKAQNEVRTQSLLIGATGAEIAVTAIAAELNLLAANTGSAADFEAISGLEAELVLLSGLTVGSAVLNAIAVNPGLAAVAVIRIEATVADAENVVIGGDTYDFSTKDTYGGGNIEVDVSGGTTAKAVGTLTATAILVAGETITIDAKVYTIVPDGTANADGEVDAGSDEADGKFDLVAAINGTDGHNTAHPTVTAAAFAGDDMVVTAIAGGVAANSLVTTETSGVASWAAGDLDAGVDPTAAEATDALIAAINASGTEDILAVDIDANEILLVQDVIGVDTTALSETMGGADNVVDAAFGDGAAGVQLKVATTARVPDAQEVATGNLHVGLDFTPSVVFVQVRVTATGVLVSWDGAAIIVGGANPYIQIDNAGGTDWSVNDTVHVIAYA